MSSKCGCVPYDVGPWALFSSLSNRMIMSSKSFVSVHYIIMWKVLKSEHSKNEQGEGAISMHSFLALALESLIFIVLMCITNGSC